MKAISSMITKTLQPGTDLVCAYNSGAKILKIITVRKYKTRRKGRPMAGVASLVNCRVLVGSEKVMHEVHRAVIVRQVKEYKRSNGMSISFEERIGGVTALKALQTYAKELDKKYGSKAFTHFRNADMNILLDT